MTLHLVVHQPEPNADPDVVEEIRATLADAVWEVAESHWAPAEETMLVSSDLSADYLLAHFRRALSRRGVTEPGFLIVAPIAERPALLGAPPAVKAWMAEAL
jgi:hypothetical protein